jgi:internalin A
MRQYWMILCLLLCLTIPLHAQDNPTPYEIALQRIQEAATTGATRLDLSIMGLTELPPEIGQLSSLEVLYLEHNELSALPVEIGQLSNLRALHLHYNQLSALPVEIGQLSNLQMLTLYGNQLSALPAEIGQLSSLEGLDVADNELSALPAEIGQLSNLQGLSLEHNQLRYLPLTMGNLAGLQCADFCTLLLDNNPLISPPPEVVEQGTEAVLEYLRNQAWYHIQRLIIGSASGVGLLAVLILGVRYRQHRRKPKAKRG